MINGFLLLLVAASIIGMLALTRTWALEQEGVDLDRERMEWSRFRNFSRKQKIILGLLLIPTAVFILMFLIYLLATVVVSVVGVS